MSCREKYNAINKKIVELSENIDLVHEESTISKKKKKVLQILVFFS